MNTNTDFDNIVAEYVWLGGNNELRSKVRVLNVQNDLWSSTGDFNMDFLPKWNYDGSSTNQASGNDSEVIIYPRKAFPCPFRGKPNLLVMCDTYKPDGTPLSNNHRNSALEIFNSNTNENPWYGMEQEFFLIDKKTGLPLGVENLDTMPAQGQYYCSVGSNNAFGRGIIDEHLFHCINAGITISGINAEVAPGQWEYQVGPVLGIDAGDQLWMSRYILERICEKYNVSVNWEPKPLIGDWNGSGCHVNFSTESTRYGNSELNKTGLDYINEYINKLEQNHNMHMENYGSGNKDRMTGLHETASYDKFNYGVANRGASIRIGNDVYTNKKGYFEDRRPSSNMDPYIVTSLIYKTCCL